LKKKIDLSLYLVTDRELSVGRPLDDIVSAAVRGGVSAVQLREKNCSTIEYINLALRIKDILAGPQIPLIINDRIDVALAVKADGVHVGQNDMPYHMARQILGPKAIIGLTVETVEQAKEAESLDADYLGVSAIFATPTKTDTATEWGMSGLRSLRSLSNHTLIGIGGINHSNTADVLASGADGIAIVSAICAAPDPEKATREFRDIIEAQKIKHN
jgi:thiamine-phosphate pyrophosphorylase